MSRAVAASCSHNASASANCAVDDAAGAGALARAHRLLWCRNHKRVRPSRPPVRGGARCPLAAWEEPGAMRPRGSKPPGSGAA
eukprot:8399784-Alexandrium_andersonii.AAC.1